MFNKSLASAYITYYTLVLDSMQVSIETVKLMKIYKLCKSYASTSSDSDYNFFSFKSSALFGLSSIAKNEPTPPEILPALAKLSKNCS